MPYAITPGRTAKMVALHLKNKSAKEIAFDLKVDDGTVYKTFYREGWVRMLLSPSEQQAIKTLRANQPLPARAAG